MRFSHGDMLLSTLDSQVLVELVIHESTLLNGLVVHQC